MSNLKAGWLWVIVGVEIAAIAGLLVWALVIRGPKETPKPTTTTQQPAPKHYNEPKLALTQVVGGLTQPTAIVAASKSTTDKRLFVVEQTGVIRVINNGTLSPDAFLDISSKVQDNGEMGLLGLAFAPDQTKRPYFYVNYVDKTQTTHIARFTITKAADGTWKTDPASEKTLLTVKQPYPNHKGGNLAFGPDGYLYIGLGDGGSGGDPENRAQNKNELLGKLLRVDVNNGDTYAIPSSNPFVKEGGKPEIWALGLRNPWRFSFDRLTGDLYIADVGQATYEEIDLQKAGSTGGQNYGWRCYEANHDFNTAGCQAATNYTPPILEYAHQNSRCSVTGGYVYRGKKFPMLKGKYFYADYCTGEVFDATQKAGVWTSVLAAPTGYNVSTFGEDSGGELYLANYAAGTIYQLTDSAN